MSQWFMLSLTGKDQAGIAARVTSALFESGCHLGEASMMRLGTSFSMMLMVRTERSRDELFDALRPTAEALDLHVHLDPIEGGLHQHQVPDVRITVHGADRAGIVSQVTSRLANAGLNILDLESDVGGTDEEPIYIMIIEGSATKGLEAIEGLEQELEQQAIDVRIEPIQTYLG
jgi:glycine cleavage system transcriptional repressor